MTDCGALEELDKIKQDVDVQDEKLMNIIALRKCFNAETKKWITKKEEIEKQIGLIAKGAPFQDVAEISRSLPRAIEKQKECFKYCSKSIDERNVLIQLMRKDHKQWEEKYTKLLVEYKEELNSQKVFYESINLSFKRLQESIKNRALAEVVYKQLRQKVKHLQDMIKQRKIIKEKIFHTRMIKIAENMLALEKGENNKILLKELVDEKKTLLKMLFELQETNKKRARLASCRNVRPNYIKNLEFSNQQFSKPSISSECTLSNILTTRKIPLLNLEAHESKGIETQQASKDVKLPLNENIPKVRILDVKKIKLPGIPPLKSILRRNNSNLNSSFSNAPNKCSQNEKTSKDNTPANSQELPDVTYKNSQNSVDQALVSKNLSQQSNKEDESRPAKRLKMAVDLKHLTLHKVPVPNQQAIDPNKQVTLFSKNRESLEKGTRQGFPKTAISNVSQNSQFPHKVTDYFGTQKNAVVSNAVIADSVKHSQEVSDGTRKPECNRINSAEDTNLQMGINSQEVANSVTGFRQPILKPTSEFAENNPPQINDSYFNFPLKKAKNVNFASPLEVFNTKLAEAPAALQEDVAVAEEPRKQNATKSFLDDTSDYPGYKSPEFNMSYGSSDNQHPLAENFPLSSLTNVLTQKDHNAEQPRFTFGMMSSSHSAFNMFN